MLVFRSTPGPILVALDQTRDRLLRSAFRSDRSGSAYDFCRDRGEDYFARSGILFANAQREIRLFAKACVRVFFPFSRFFSGFHNRPQIVGKKNACRPLTLRLELGEITSFHDTSAPSSTVTYKCGESNRSLSQIRRGYQRYASPDRDEHRSPNQDLAGMAGRPSTAH